MNGFSYKLMEHNNTEKTIHTSLYKMYFFFSHSCSYKDIRYRFLLFSISIFIHLFNYKQQIQDTKTVGDISLFKDGRGKSFIVK